MILVLAVLLQDAEWIDALGHEDVEVRQRAEERLAGRGDAVLPALRAAAVGADPERKGRIERVITRILWKGAWDRDLQADVNGIEAEILDLFRLYWALKAFPPLKPRDLARIPFPAEDAVWSVLRKEPFADGPAVKGPDVPGRDPEHETWRFRFAARSEAATLQRMDYFIRATKRTRGSDPILYLLQPRERFDLSEKGLALQDGVPAALKTFARPGWKLKGGPPRVFKNDDKATSGVLWEFSEEGAGRDPYPSSVFLKARWALLVFY